MQLPSPVARRIRSCCRACDAMRLTKAATRPATVLAVLAAFSFLVTACGGGEAHNGVASLGNAKTTTTQSSAATGSSSSGQSVPTEAQLLKYAVCMRSHGLRDFPDPVPALGGGFAFKTYPGSDFNPVSPSPQFQSATKACQKDVPPSLANLTPAQMAANALKYTDCMRSHGEQGFPDPNSQGLIKDTNATGIMDPNSPQFQRAENACRSLNNGSFAEQITPSSGGPSSDSAHTDTAPPAQAAAQKRQRIAFVRCMRTNGVRNFPYPTAQGAVSVAMVEAADINPQSPVVVRVVVKCLPRSLLPPKTP